MLGDDFDFSGLVPRGIRQWYLAIDEDKTVRIRLDGDLAFMTVKGKSSGASRVEIETAIDFNAAAMTECFKVGSVVEKDRFELLHEGQTWELDRFAGGNAGLLIAEAEIPSEDHPLAIPPWAGREVTKERDYSNAALAKRPFSTWDKSVRKPAP